MNMSEINGSCNCAEQVNHIKCEVASCVYNKQSNCCTASMIEVAPDCCGEGQTCCRTYKKN